MDRLIAEAHRALDDYMETEPDTTSPAFRVASALISLVTGMERTRLHGRANDAADAKVPRSMSHEHECPECGAHDSY